MRASAFEYRFRFAIHAVVYMLGFWSPWLYPPFAAPSSTAGEPSWLALSTVLFRQGWLTYNAAVVSLLVVAMVLTALGAWFRVWGTAYVGAGVVASGDMHGQAMLADGPYRRTRNPLYLGTILHTLGLALLMPASGAVFAVVLLWVFQIRLALAEEPFLEAKFGQAYMEYKAAVPQFLPAPKPQWPAGGMRPRWVQSVLGELYFVLAFLVLAVFGWGYDKTTLRQGILISLGVWLVVRAFLPRAQEAGSGK